MSIMKGTYTYDTENWQVTQQMVQDYEELGYIFVKGLFSPEEIKKLITALEHPEGVRKHAFSLDDGGDRKLKLTIWGHPGNDYTGMIGRCEKIATTTEILMGGKEVYHYHTKLIMKEPFTGGKFEWHQDYGYWYINGFLRPDLLTVWVAVDKSDKENGCVQIIPGTHRCGRIDHNFVGGQNGADEERVKQILNFPGNKAQYIEAQPGDALFFHCNLLHKSEPNSSNRRRWGFASAYCRADNNPVYVHHCPQYTPLHKVPNSAILECDNFTDMSGKEFMDPNKDKSIKYTVEVGEQEENKTS